MCTSVQVDTECDEDTKTNIIVVKVAAVLLIVEHIEDREYYFEEGTNMSGKRYEIVSELEI